MFEERERERESEELDGEDARGRVGKGRRRRREGEARGSAEIGPNRDTVGGVCGGRGDRSHYQFPHQ